jgi:hypothetical protein
MNARLLPLLFTIALSLLASPVSAARCKHKGEREAVEPAADLTTVEVFARAGELRIRGSAHATEVRARGDACASREDMLAVMDITMRQLPDRLQVLVEMPDISGDTNRAWRDELALMDLAVDLPDTVKLIVHDSSGGIEISNVAGLELTDSSGDIEVDQVSGPVLIPMDSSGDIELKGVGAVTIQTDSAGEIYIDSADSVTIATDTSGDIRLYRIQGDVIIGTDSSGAIIVEDVGGRFIVENDASGDIRYREVAGAVSLPESRRGD